jgi:hypothetical protein
MASIVEIENGGRARTGIRGNSVDSRSVDETTCGVTGQQMYSRGDRARQMAPRRT